VVKVLYLFEIPPGEHECRKPKTGAISAVQVPNMSIKKQMPMAFEARGIQFPNQYTSGAELSEGRLAAVSRAADITEKIAIKSETLRVNMGEVITVRAAAANGSKVAITGRELIFFPAAA